MEAATPTLPSAWPGLERREGRVADHQEARQEAVRSIPHELATEWQRALAGQHYDLRSTVVRTDRIDRGGLAVINTRRVETSTTLVDELIEGLTEGGLDLQLREVLTECPCPYARNLSALIRARVFRDLTESVLSALTHAEVVEALKAMALRSVHPLVVALVEACREHYISTQAPRIAEARGIA